MLFFVDRLHVNFDILVILFLYFCICLLLRRETVCVSGVIITHILSHCICVHQQRYLPQRDSNPLPPGSELPTLPMSLYILHFAKKKLHIENLFGQVLYNLH